MLFSRIRSDCKVGAVRNTEAGRGAVGGRQVGEAILKEELAQRLVAPKRNQGWLVGAGPRGAFQAEEKETAV